MTTVGDIFGWDIIVFESWCSPNNRQQLKKILLQNMEIASFPAGSLLFTFPLSLCMLFRGCPGSFTGFHSSALQVPILYIHFVFPLSLLFYPLCMHDLIWLFHQGIHSMHPTFPVFHFNGRHHNWLQHSFLLSPQAETQYIIRQYTLGSLTFCQNYNFSVI